MPATKNLLDQPAAHWFEGVSAAIDNAEHLDPNQYVELMDALASEIAMRRANCVSAHAGDFDHTELPRPEGTFTLLRSTSYELDTSDGTLRTIHEIEWDDGDGGSEGPALTNDDVRSLGLVGTRCEHSYDCCGHRYFSAPTIIGQSYGTWFVEQTSSLNV